jgi:toxin ParE1/3/4
MRLIWTENAHADRKDIREYIAQDNPFAALALDELFEAKAQLLLDYPYRARPGAIEGTRELAIQRNYLLIYDVSEDAIRILRVLHGARQWPPV